MNNTPVVFLLKVVAIVGFFALIFLLLKLMPTLSFKMAYLWIYSAFLVVLFLAYIVYAIVISIKRSSKHSCDALVYGRILRTRHWGRRTILFLSLTADIITYLPNGKIKIVSDIVDDDSSVGEYVLLKYSFGVGFTVLQKVNKNTIPSDVLEHINSSPKNSIIK